jgi:hypothetical protein
MGYIDLMVGRPLVPIKFLLETACQWAAGLLPPIVACLGQKWERFSMLKTVPKRK